MANYMQVPTQLWKENILLEEKGIWKGHSKPVDRVHGFLLAESLPGEQSHSSSSWSLLSSQSMRALSFGHPTLFNLGFYLLIFYNSVITQ